MESSKGYLSSVSFQRVFDYYSYLHILKGEIPKNDKKSFLLNFVHDIDINYPTSLIYLNFFNVLDGLKTEFVNFTKMPRTSHEEIEIFVKNRSKRPFKPTRLSTMFINSMITPYFNANLIAHKSAIYLLGFYAFLYQYQKKTKNWFYLFGTSVLASYPFMVSYNLKLDHITKGRESLSKQFLLKNALFTVVDNFLVLCFYFKMCEIFVQNKKVRNLHEFEPEKLKLFEATLTNNPTLKRSIQKTQINVDNTLQICANIFSMGFLTALLYTPVTYGLQYMMSVEHKKIRNIEVLVDENMITRVKICFSTNFLRFVIQYGIVMTIFKLSDNI